MSLQTINQIFVGLINPLASMSTTTRKTSNDSYSKSKRRPPLVRTIGELLVDHPITETLDVPAIFRYPPTFRGLRKVFILYSNLQFPDLLTNATYITD